MFEYVALAISIVASNFSDYVNTSGKFTRKSKWRFEDYINYILFNNRKSIDVELGNYFEKAINLAEITKQSISKQRVFIKPEIFIDISNQFLKNIHYNNQKLFKTFKGFRLVAIDGSDFEIPNITSTRLEFNVKNPLTRTNPSHGKFSSAMDVLNGFILDGAIDNFRKADLNFVEDHINKCKQLININKTIFIFDRGYVSLSLYATLLSNKTYFVSRLAKNSYIHERKYLKSDDETIIINANSSRLNKFKNILLKRKCSKRRYLELRLVTVHLPNNKKEYLLTNLNPDKFTHDDINKIYESRWGIECNYKIMKSRLQIENYTSIKRINIAQDIYAKFLIYNIFCFMESYTTQLINKNKQKKGNNKKYKVRQSTLIGRLIHDLPIMILNPKRDIIRHYLQKIIHWSCKNPILIKKQEPTPRKKAFNIKYKHNIKPLF